MSTKVQRQASDPNIRKESQDKGVTRRLRLRELPRNLCSQLSSPQKVLPHNAPLREAPRERGGSRDRTKARPYRGHAPKVSQLSQRPQYRRRLYQELQRPLYWCQGGGVSNLRPRQTQRASNIDDLRSPMLVLRELLFHAPILKVNAVSSREL